MIDAITKLSPLTAGRTPARMGPSRIVFTLCFVSASLWAQGGEITIRLYDYSGIQAQALTEAQRSAGEILGQAGIAVRWQNCPVPGSGVASKPDCSVDPDEFSTFLVTLLTGRMSGKIATKPQQFGLAMLSRESPFPTRSHIYSGRVVDFARAERTSWTRLLGSVIAHEVGHLLLGSNSHSATGIMRAQWRQEDLMLSLRDRLGFSAQQAEQIRSDVRRRSEQQREAQTTPNQG